MEDEEVTNFHVFFEDVAQEREEQDADWGGEEHDDGHDDGIWLGILTKQVGDVSREIIGANNRKRLYDELVQVAAVASAWGERLLRAENARFSTANNVSYVQSEEGRHD